MNATPNEFHRTPEQIANTLARVRASFPDGITDANFQDFTLSFDSGHPDEGLLRVVVVTRISIEDAVAIVDAIPLDSDDPEADEDGEAPFLDHTDQVAERMIEDQEAGR